MSYILKCFLLCLCFVFLSFGQAPAVNINVPSTARPGETVTYRVMSQSSSGAYTCVLQINFGDSATWQNLLPFCTSTSCTQTTNHIYSATGAYNIRVRPNPTILCTDINPPLTPSRTINIIQSSGEVTMPDGTVAMEYSYQFGVNTNRYQKVGGRLDRGLRIIGNKLTGIPEQAKNYRFRVRATSPDGAIVENWYNLTITKARLTVTTTPQKITLNRNRPGTFRLTYNFKSSEPLNDTLMSARGVFWGGSRKLGILNTGITTEMTAGQARLSEQVTISLNVIKMAQRLGVKNIRYQRTFIPRYMDAATTGAVAVTVGTGFTFTKIRITFLDHTGKRFVKRNEKIDGAMVELRYEGAGLLKGYWQVDDRILARVTKSLPFANGRTITLQLPGVPPLPTYSTGSHRLRFVIVNPVMNIPFPQVIYIVSGEDPSKVHAIQLISPEDNADLRADNLSFSWKSRVGVVLYHLELFENTKEERRVVFSSYSKKAIYTVPTSRLCRKLRLRSSYFWRVTGLDEDNKPIAGSRQRKFKLVNDDLNRIPKYP